MSIGLLFWVIMVVWLIFNFGPTPATWKNHGGFILLFILFGILGWAVFGPAIHR